MSTRESPVLGWVVVCGDGTILAESIGGVPIFNDYADAGAQALRVGGHVRPAVKPQFFASESMSQAEAPPRRKKTAPVTATAEPISSAHSSNGTQEDDDEDAEAPRVLVGWKPQAIEKEASSSRRRPPASND